MNAFKSSLLRRTLIAVFLSVASFAYAQAAVTRVACVGDSITYGYGLRDRKANAYPEQLGRWLGTNYDVRNFGVSATTLLHQGDKPYIKEKAYTNALDFKPDILVIDLGANDSKHPGDGSLAADKAVNNWQFKTNYIADYEELIAAFRKSNPAAKIYVCLPTPDFPGRWGINDRTIREEMIPMIRTVAQDLNASIIDLHTALSGKAELFPDSVHPNDAGAKLMAAAIYRGLTGHEPPAALEPAASLFMNRRVLWLGDSITQDGTYVSIIEYYLNKKFPAETFDFIDLALPSETVSGLSEKTHPFPRPCVFERLQRALDAVKPATVVACYGMNDGIYHPQNDERTKLFQDGIHRLINAAQSAKAQVIILTPPPYDPIAAGNSLPATAPDFGYRNAFTNYDSVLADYSRWELTLPPTDARLVVDLHTPVNDFVAQQRAKNPAFKLSKDGVHLSALGHLVMAEAVLRAMGFSAGGNDQEAELTRIEADPFFKLVNERRQKRGAGWLDYVGYTRGKTVKTNSVDAVETAATVMQTKIDAIRRGQP